MTEALLDLWCRGIVCGDACHGLLPLATRLVIWLTCGGPAAGWTHGRDVRKLAVTKRQGVISW